jgi:hypothetical protein
MAFKASDYPDVVKASDAYDVARSEFQKLDRLLTETPTSSKEYKNLVARRNAAKEKADKALSNFKRITKERKTEFEETQLKKATEKKTRDIESRIKSLNDSRQRTLDKNESTSAIDAAIAKAQEELDKVLAGEKPKEEEKKKTEEKRPLGVPAGAQFSAVTGQWTLGNKKWSADGKEVGAKKQVTKTDEAADTAVTGDEAVVVEGVFDPGRFRMADSASVAALGETTEADFAKVLAQAQSEFGGIDEIFKTDEDLRKLLIKAVGDPNKIGDEYSVQRFVSELENTKWFKTNAGPIRKRGFYERQYNELVKNLKMDDPQYKEKMAELERTSEWGRGLQSTVETVNEYVTQLLGIGALDDTTIRSIASEIYKYANEDDAVKIRNAVLGAAKYGKGAVIGGKAAETLSTLKAIAGANGFDLESQFATDLPTWIDRINKGESIETYKKIIRDAAKTAFGVSDRVSALMDQGVNLETIYSPYKNVMATVLEINPQTITLKDLSDKGVFGAKDEMNLYDFQRVLRKDSRWQYTQNAREDVSNSALQVLRDFGFQG